MFGKQWRSPESEVGLPCGRGVHGAAPVCPKTTDLSVLIRTVDRDHFYEHDVQPFLIDTHYPQLA